MRVTISLILQRYRIKLKDPEKPIKAYNFVSLRPLKTELIFEKLA
jgi:hypothetical protein